jgi:hypothetical protein
VLSIGGGRLVWANNGREYDSMVESLERGVLMRHMEMLVGDVCSQQYACTHVIHPHLKSSSYFSFGMELGAFGHLSTAPK